MFGMKSKFSRNVMVLTTGTALSQLIPFIVLPILQKYFYGPADFALLASFVYFSEMIGVVSTLKLEYAIVAQRTPQDAREVAATGYRVVSISTLFSIVLAVICFQWDVIHGLHKLGTSIFLLPLVVLAMGSMQITSYWFNARQEYPKIAQGKLVQTATSEGVKLASGFAGLNFTGLIIGRVLGYVSVAVLQWRRFAANAAGIERRHFSKWDTIKRHKSYVLFTTPSVFVGALINFLYIEMFLEHFGSESAGMVSVAMTYVGAGLGMVAGSISQVFFGTISNIHKRKELESLYVRFLGRLFLMSGVMTAMVWVFPASWIVGVLGPEWNDLIVYCRVISVWLGVWFISSSLSFIYLRLQRQHLMLFMDVLHVVIIYVGFHMGRISTGTALGALWGFTWAQVSFYVMAILLAIYFIRTSKLLHDE
jgi:lipopolysaccharide exporter